jgi:hypothetical protein
MTLTTKSISTSRSKPHHHLKSFEILVYFLIGFFCLIHKTNGLSSSGLNLLVDNLMNEKTNEESYENQPTLDRKSAGDFLSSALNENRNHRLQELLSNNAEIRKSPTYSLAEQIQQTPEQQESIKEKSYVNNEGVFFDLLAKHGVDNIDALNEKRLHPKSVGPFQQASPIHPTSLTDSRLRKIFKLNKALQRVEKKSYKLPYKMINLYHDTKHKDPNIAKQSITGLNEIVSFIPDQLK